VRFDHCGWQILFVPDALAMHHKGYSSRSRPIFVEWHKHRGMVRFYRKLFQTHYPKPLMWLIVVGVWFRFFLVAALLSLRIGIAKIGR
jgi:GT2 family glycosyltransferase